MYHLPQLHTQGSDASIAWMAQAMTRCGIGIAIATATTALAQPPAALPPILHEPIPDLHSATPGAAIGGGSNPTAIAVGDKVLPQPALTPPSSAVRQAAVLGTKDFSADRQTAMKPDGNTGPDQTLHYISVFNPDVLPWKRMSAFDQVNDDFTLHIRRSALHELVVGGASSSTRDPFWGDMRVQLRPGVDVALPSVAPDMRILSYETNPKLRLVFSKDGADNFYVRSDESNAVGTFHLVFYADADAGYFASQLPSRNYRVRDVAAHAPSEIKPALPDAVMREAATTLRNLGLHPELDLGLAFNRLVEWGRGFAAGELRRPAGNLYRDLCDHQIGVCRHRSYAFMVTANALGIPTRLVENEAHAFVEVWFPDRNWQRIDLGGAAMQLEVSGADNKQLHRPRAGDPFAKPPQYRHNYTQLEGNIAGLTDQQRADRRKPLAESLSSGSATATTSSGVTPDPSLATAAPDPVKLTPTLAVTRASTSAYRGDLVHVEGTVRIGSRALANHFVAVYLSPAGENGAHPIHLGSLTSGPDGIFRGDLPVPAQLALSTYEVYVASREDASYNAALSN